MTSEVGAQLPLSGSPKSRLGPFFKSKDTQHDMFAHLFKSRTDLGTDFLNMVEYADRSGYRFLTMVEYEVKRQWDARGVEAGTENEPKVSPKTGPTFWPQFA